MSDEETRGVFRQFEDEALENPLAARLERARLANDPDARRDYEQLVRIERVMEHGAPVTRGQLARMRALGPPMPAKQSTSRTAALASIGLMIAAIAAALLLVPRQDEWASRGGASAGPRAWIRIFSVRGDVVRPASAKIASSDGLVFAYSHLADSDLAYLAIAGRDASGAVHWYHPAYRTRDDKPTSIRIEKGVADRELRERVFAKHAPGPLEICALFTREPLDVRDVDRRLERGEAWPDATKDCHTIEVLDDAR